MLTDKEILKELKKKENLIIEPFKRENLGPNSYDLTIYPIIKIFKKENKIKTLKEKFEMEKVNLPYELKPNESLIFMTNEIIAVKKNFVGLLSPRSNLSRSPLIFSMSFLVDTGFVGRVSGKITNMGFDPILIYPNIRIIQLMVFKIHKVLISYDKRYLSKNLDQFIEVPEYKPDKDL